MSAQENKDLARRFMDEVWNKGNLDFIDEVTDPNFVSHDPASPEDVGGGVEGVRRFVEMYRNAFPDIQMSVEDVIAEGDKVSHAVDGACHAPRRAYGHPSKRQPGGG